MEIPDKLYLDTNIVERYFKKAILTRRRKKKFKIPFIFQLLQNRKVQLFISTFTLAEVFEHLWKIYRATPKETAKLTQKFLHEFNVSLILDFFISSNILRWIRKRKLEAKDVIHLSISISHNLTILSADENFFERGKAIYGDIILDRTLIKRLTSSPS